MANRSEKIAIFDLDNTLIGGDSELLWAEFLVSRGILEGNFMARMDASYQKYLEGTLDLEGALAYQLDALTRAPLEELRPLRKSFLKECIEPVMLAKAVALVRRHELDGHRTLIITATNYFVTEPIARLFGVSELIAVDLEVVDGEFTGRAVGTPSFREGKVERFEEWQRARGIEAGEAWFYSDSHNDLPLLCKVQHPVAVDPDRRLREEALARNWPIISLR